MEVLVTAPIQNIFSPSEMVDLKELYQKRLTVKKGSMLKYNYIYTFEIS